MHLVGFLLTLNYDARNRELKKSCIKLVFYSSTIAMMHGPINIRNISCFHAGQQTLTLRLSPVPSVTVGGSLLSRVLLLLSVAMPGERRSNFITKQKFLAVKNSIVSKFWSNVVKNFVPNFFVVVCCYVLQILAFWTYMSQRISQNFMRCQLSVAVSLFYFIGLGTKGVFQVPIQKFKDQDI